MNGNNSCKTLDENRETDFMNSTLNTTSSTNDDTTLVPPNNVDDHDDERNGSTSIDSGISSSAATSQNSHSTTIPISDTTHSQSHRGRRRNDSSDTISSDNSSGTSKILIQQPMIQPHSNSNPIAIIGNKYHEQNNNNNNLKITVITSAESPEKSEENAQTTEIIAKYEENKENKESQENEKNNYNENIIIEYDQNHDQNSTGQEISKSNEKQLVGPSVLISDNPKTMLELVTKQFHIWYYCKNRTPLQNGFSFVTAVSATGGSTVIGLKLAHKTIRINKVLHSFTRSITKFHHLAGGTVTAVTACIAPLIAFGFDIYVCLKKWLNNEYSCDDTKNAFGFWKEISYKFAGAGLGVLVTSLGVTFVAGRVDFSNLVCLIQKNQKRQKSAHMYKEKKPAGSVFLVLFLFFSYYSLLK